MSTAIKRRRGTTAQHSAFTGQLGELTIDTNKKVVVVHDGATVGGLPMASQRVANVKEYGATGNGVTDDTAAITAAIATGLDVYVPRGTYMVSGEGIGPQSNQRIFGDGFTSIIKKTVDTNPYCIYAAGKTRIIIENLCCDANRSTTADYTNSKHCIYLSTCTDCRVSGVEVKGALADGIVIEYGQGNIIQGCIAHGTNKQGIYCSGAEDVTIVGNLCYGNGSNSTGGGIAIAATFGATVMGNTCYNNIQSDIIFGRACRYLTIVGNVCGGHISGQSPLSIFCLGEQLGNTLHGVSYGDGTIYYGASFCTISNNVFRSEMRLELLTDSVVSGNSCEGSSDAGIWLTGCTGISLSNNRIKDYTNNAIKVGNTTKNGTVASTYCEIRNNAITKSGGASATAMSISVATGTFVSGNTLNGVTIQEVTTFTPTLVPSGTGFDAITYNSSRFGYYIKIGNVVHFQLMVRTDAITAGSASGTLRVGGLPFAASASIPSQSVAIGRSEGFATNQPTGGRIASGATVIDIYYRAASNGVSTSMGVAEAANGSAKNEVHISGTYLTDL